MTDLTTPDPDAEVKSAAMIALVAAGSRVLAEATRGHRAAGPAIAFELIESSDVPMLGVMTAALTACANLSAALADERGQDPDEFLTEWLDAALADERADLARLARLTGGGGGA